MPLEGKNTKLLDLCGQGGGSLHKALQVKRLEQAHATGSDLLVTACPKCQMHLKCAMEDPFRREQCRSN